MSDEHEAALDEFMRVFDARLNAAPVMDRRAIAGITDRRAGGQDKPVEARRASGPVNRDFAYWVTDRPRDAGR